MRAKKMAFSSESWRRHDCQPHVSPYAQIRSNVRTPMHDRYLGRVYGLQKTCIRIAYLLTSGYRPRT